MKKRKVDPQVASNSSLQVFQTQYLTKESLITKIKERCLNGPSDDPLVEATYKSSKWVNKQHFKEVEKQIQKEIIEAKNVLKEKVEANFNGDHPVQLRLFTDTNNKKILLTNSVEKPSKKS